MNIVNTQLTCDWFSFSNMGRSGTRFLRLGTNDILELIIPCGGYPVSSLCGFYLLDASITTPPSESGQSKMSRDITKCTMRGKMVPSWKPLVWHGYQKYQVVVCEILETLSQLMPARITFSIFTNTTLELCQDLKTVPQTA